MLNEVEFKKLKKGIVVLLGILVLFYVPSIITFFRVHTGRKFTIYLVETPQTYKGIKDISLEYFQLADQPFIQESDISGYDFENGIIYFDPQKKTIDSITYLKLIGRVFVVCLGKERLYYGTFWTYKIAHGTDTIIVVPDRQGIKLEPGYFGMNKSFASLIHHDEIRKRFARINKLR
ncbi:MAG: hypothetical protein PHH44_05545 [bacterium]|nr:hypothetical protein [bacterium]